jgi:hypothetical protein
MTFLKTLIGLALIALGIWLWHSVLVKIHNPWVGVPLFIIVAAITIYGGLLTGFN